MHSKSVLASALLAAAILFMAGCDRGEGRYLPTRAASDRVDKLRELLKELLENEIANEENNDIPRWHPENQLFYKREVREAKPEKSVKETMPETDPHKN